MERVQHLLSEREEVGGGVTRGGGEVERGGDKAVSG